MCSELNLKEDRVKDNQTNWGWEFQKKGEDLGKSCRSAWRELRGNKQHEVLERLKGTSW